MIVETARAVHFSAGFVVAPQIELSNASFLKFQGMLNERGLSFDNANRGPQHINIASSEDRIQLQLTHAGPQLTQIGVSVEEPRHGLNFFIQNCEEVAKAISLVWPARLNIVTRQVLVRYLYRSKDQHAFKFLWEKRLNRAPNELDVLGRPVLGGGLRFVMPPTGPDNPEQLEVKVESLLRDSTMIFVEAQMVVQQANAESQNPAEALNPRNLLERLNHYVSENVVRFVLDGQET